MTMLVRLILPGINQSSYYLVLDDFELCVFFYLPDTFPIGIEKSDYLRSLLASIVEKNIC